MKYLFTLITLFAFPAFAEPLWHCETMELHRLEHIRLGGDHVRVDKELKGYRPPVVEDIAVCKPVCKKLGCPETVRICWTDDPVTGKTKSGERFMECE